MRAESAVLPRPEGHTVARVRAPTQKSCHSERLYREESAFRASWQLSRPAPSNSQCGNHLEILWEAMIDGIFAALYVCKVSRTVGFALAASSPGLNSHRLGGPRFGL